MSVATPEGPNGRLDPVSFEIIRAGLQSIPDLVEADITRTAFSPLIYEYKDYAVGLVDAEGRSIALAQNGLPLFLTNLIGLAVRDGLRVYRDEGFQRGDVVVTNHAGTLGQHLNNVVMYTPIFNANGALSAFMGVIVHWIDIGGRYPGSSLGNDMTELAQEGLQLRSVKLYRAGMPVDEIFRIIEHNTRDPDGLLGDIAAQHAGCIKGRDLFEQLVARHGEESVRTAVATIWRNAEAASRAAVRAVADGTYEMKTFLDDDGILQGVPVPVDVKVEIRGDEFIVDYSRIGAQMRGPYNSGVEGGGETCARIAFKYLFAPHDPANEGSFAPVRIVLPPGKFLSAAPNAPMGRYSTPLPTVIDAIIAAMASLMPDRVAAGHHAAMGIYGFTGRHPETQRFFRYTDSASGGWGAGRNQDGVGPYKTLMHADNREIPVEAVEALYPLRVQEMSWRADSGGPGRHRGGLGIRKVFRVLAPCNGFLGFERFVCPPWGLDGGLPGEPGFVEIEYANGTCERVMKANGIPLSRDDVIRVHTGAGGGYGSPLARSSADVSADVARGYVSRKQAEEIYGVALHEDGSVNEEGTRRHHSDSAA